MFRQGSIRLNRLTIASSQVLEHIARRNGRTISLKIEDLHRISEPGSRAPSSWRDSLRLSFTDVSLCVP